MSVEILQEKIRKLKNPTVLELFAGKGQIPPFVTAAHPDMTDAYEYFAGTLLDELKDAIPAVRFHFNGFAAFGAEGLPCLQRLLRKAREAGYYTLLDVPESFSAEEAEATAEAFCEECWAYDGIVLSSYIGSDGIRPYTARLKNKTVFVTLRTANKSASELQELLSGSRLVYLAKADIVNRFGESFTGNNGYNQVGGTGAANSAESLRTLRSKYKHMFLLADGYDCSNANAKNCAPAFDSFGHGAAVCAGASICGAWLAAEHDGEEYLADAREAAERMKKNLLRYITIL